MRHVSTSAPLVTTPYSVRVRHVRHGPRGGVSPSVVGTGVQTSPSSDGPHPSFSPKPPGLVSLSVLTSRPLRRPSPKTEPSLLPSSLVSPEPYTPHPGRVDTHEAPPCPRGSVWLPTTQSHPLKKKKIYPKKRTLLKSKCLSNVSGASGVRRRGYECRVESGDLSAVWSCPYTRSVLALRSATQSVREGEYEISL